MAGNDTLVLETGEELSRALDTRTWGRPVALGSVIVSFNAPMSGIGTGLPRSWVEVKELT